MKKILSTLILLSGILCSISYVFGFVIFFFVPTLFDYFVVLVVVSAQSGFLCILLDIICKLIPEDTK